MGEKVYRPILKEGDHLVRSKDNDGRVRGVSQDENNKTTDIVEWEEVEIDEPQYEYPIEQYEQERVELTPEQRQLAQAVGEAIAEAAIYVMVQLHKHVVSPWWYSKAKPWIKGKWVDAKNFVSGKTKAQAIIEKKEKNETGIQLSSDTQIDEMLDAEFESVQLNMTPDEAKEHMMKLIYHMLGIAYEIKILSNARIDEHIEDETTQIEKKKEAERLLTEKMSNNINKLLSDDTLMLDVNTSKQLFGLLGGGIRISGEYVPVELEKVNAAIESMKNGNSNPYFDVESVSNDEEFLKRTMLPF